LFGFSSQCSQYLTDDMHNVEVLPVTKATNIVGIAHLSMTENNIDGRAVIFNIEPVAHVRTITVHRDGLSLQTRTDNGGYKLLIMLVRAIFIGTVRQGCWQPVGLVVRPYQMVRRCFTRRVWGVRSIWRCFAKWWIMWP